MSNNLRTNDLGIFDRTFGLPDPPSFRSVYFPGAQYHESAGWMEETALVDYHVRRNEVARKSHAKTWRAKHRGVRFLRL